MLLQQPSSRSTCLTWWSLGTATRQRSGKLGACTTLTQAQLVRAQDMLLMQLQKDGCTEQRLCMPQPQVPVHAPKHLYVCCLSMNSAAAADCLLFGRQVLRASSSSGRLPSCGCRRSPPPRARACSLLCRRCLLVQLRRPAPSLYYHQHPRQQPAKSRVSCSCSSSQTRRRQG